MVLSGGSDAEKRDAMVARLREWRGDEKKRVRRSNTGEGDGGERRRCSTEKKRTPLSFNPNPFFNFPMFYFLVLIVFCFIFFFFLNQYFYYMFYSFYY